MVIGCRKKSLAELYISIGDDTAAIQVYQQALVHAEKIDSLPQQAHCHFALSMLYEKTPMQLKL